MESLPVIDFSLNHLPSGLLELPYNTSNHARSASRASSVYSAISAVDSIAESACSRFTTPPRASPPVRQHGPLLLPKIRSQDQQLDQSHSHSHSRSNSIRSAASARPRMVHQQATPPPSASSSKPSHHARSYTNPETLANMAFAHISPFHTPPPQSRDEAPVFPSSLIASPQSFSRDLPQQPRRTSTIDTATIGYPTYRQMPFVPSTAAAAAASQQDFMFSSYLPRAPSPLALTATAATPSSEPSTSLMRYLTCANPAAALVRTISFPLRDPSIKHFWWDVRSVSPWSSFTASAILCLPGASALLNSPVPASLLQTPAFSSRHPETEAALHSIYASYYLPKLNSALAAMSSSSSSSSSRPLQLSVPAKTSSGVHDLVFVANPIGESSTASAIFGGKPTGRVVGLVRSFDRFNTGMRAEGNIKRVDYLRGLAALHYAMREHGCRYGFILTEIELVLVRAGTEATPFFGDLEITSVQLNAAVSELDSADHNVAPPMTACLALWGLCQLAADQTPAGHAHWKAEIGAPADGTRRKARARDNWIPKPQLAEKREAKRSRGWVWPEDPIGRKEMGKRGVKYGGLC
ncbi:hypothetical protein ACQKWADRAFT_302277 [Trichoderma austrokoningii]